MEALLEVGGFDMERGVEIMTQVHMNVQKCDFRQGSMPCEFDRIVSVEELGERVGTMRPKEKNVIYNPNTLK